MRVKKIVMALFILSLAFHPSTTAFNLFTVLDYSTRWAEIFVRFKAGLDHLMVDKSLVKQTVSDKNFTHYAGDIPQTINQIVASIKISPENNPTNGILLYGQPGTGKTLLAECIAGEIGCPLFATTAAQFNNSSDGGGESLLRGLFDDAHKAAASHGTAIIFIDEFDAFGQRNQTESDINNQKKTGVITTLLHLLDNKSSKEMYFHQTKTDQAEAYKTNTGIWIYLFFLKKSYLRGYYGKGKILFKFIYETIISYLPFMNSKKGHVIIIGATNHLDAIDSAIIRSGRFNHLIELELPNKNSREKIIHHYLGETNIPNINEKIAQLTESWSAADIKDFITYAHNCSSKNIIKIHSLAWALLTHRKMNPNTPAFLYQKKEVVKKYENEPTFANDINYKDLLNYTHNMPINLIENIFIKAQLYAKQNKSTFVTIYHFAQASVDIEDLFKKQQIKQAKKILTVLTTLYPCELKIQEILPTLQNKNRHELLYIFKESYKNKTYDKIKLEDIKKAQNAIAL